MRTNNAKEAGGGSPLRDDGSAEHPSSARAINRTKSFDQLSLFGLPSELPCLMLIVPPSALPSRLLVRLACAPKPVLVFIEMVT